MDGLSSAHSSLYLHLRPFHLEVCSVKYAAFSREPALYPVILMATATHAAHIHIRECFKNCQHLKWAIMLRLCCGRCANKNSESNSGKQYCQKNTNIWTSKHRRFEYGKVSGDSRNKSAQFASTKLSESHRSQFSTLQQNFQKKMEKKLCTFLSTIFC